MSASKKYGYVDPDTGKIETLPLETETYDPVKEIRKLYGEGKEVVYYQYSIGRGNWGEPRPWTPDEQKKKKSSKGAAAEKQTPKPTPKQIQGTRGIRDLTPDEKAILELRLGAGVPNKDIMFELRLKRSSIDQYRHSLKKKGELQHISKESHQKHTHTTEQIIDPWEKAERMINSIIRINKEIATLVNKRDTTAKELRELLSDIEMTGKNEVKICQ